VAEDEEAIIVAEAEDLKLTAAVDSLIYVRSHDKVE
jgi:hypothetical protein